MGYNLGDFETLVTLDHSIAIDVWNARRGKKRSKSRDGLTITLVAQPSLLSQDKSEASDRSSPFFWSLVELLGHLFPKKVAMRWHTNSNSGRLASIA